MHILEKSLREAHVGGRTALIPFITAGFPTVDIFWKSLQELDEAGADVVEIGVPFSDPVADGPMVEAASILALEQGMTLSLLLQGLAMRPGRAPRVLMGYYNPFLQYGLERLAADAAQAGVAGCIVPDLPLGQDHALRTCLRAHNLALIPLVGPNTSTQRMQAYAAEGEGYAYVVSLLGITGVRHSLPPETADTLRRARQAFSLPLALGFGLREPAQLSALPEDVRPDAVVFGSALLQHLQEGGTAKEFLQVWTAPQAKSHASKVR